MRPAAELEEAYDQSKREILEDVRTGRVPATVRDFSALHDHVDANEYGGLCAERKDWEIEDVARVQEIVDRWLRRIDLATNRVRDDMESRREDGDPCGDCGRPSSWDGDLGWYVHDEDDAPSCFLIQYRRSDHPASEVRFQTAARAFLDAARKLERVWHDDETGWNADERLPLSRPLPLSLDEWILELAEDWKIDRPLGLRETS